MDERTDMESRRRKRTDLDETTNKSTTFPKPKLSYDILFLILLKLPERSLARLKCVSKEFKAVITDPAFIALLRPSLIIQIQSRSFPTLSSSLFKHFHIVFPNAEEIPLEMPADMPLDSYLLGSCHGLLCFLYYKGGNHIHYAYNTLTKRWITAPPIQSSGRRLHVLYHKSSTNTYQLLVHVLEGSNSYNGYMVHELGTASWRAVSEMNFPYVPFKGRQTTSVAMFGCLYWICSSMKRHQNRMILSFDVEKEQIGCIKEPPGVLLPHDTSEALTLIETDAGLGYPMFTHCTMDIWVMKGRNKAWEKKYVINLEPVQGSLKTSPSFPSYVVLLITLGEIWFLDYKVDRSKLTICDSNFRTFRSVELRSLIPECYTRVLNYSLCQWKSPISLNAF